MIDLALIRNNPDLIKRKTAAKQIDPLVIDKVLDLDKKRRDLIKRIEELREKRNKIARIGQVSEEGKQIKERLKELEPRLKRIEEELENYLLEIPNPAADDVKIGKDETENEIIKKWGQPKKFDFKIKDHLTLGEALGIIDVSQAAKVSGTRFYYLKGEGVILEFALIQFALKVLLKEGFLPIIPPVLIKEEMMKGMGYLEHGGRENMYILDKDKMMVVGTSEQSIGPMHANEILDEKKLPLRYLGFSSCFRREAGTYGKDTRGIFRVHQFDKLEMFSFTKPEWSDKEHEFFLSLEEKLFQTLEIPYQVVKMCTGDLGAPAAKKYDLEAWIPSQQKYREVTSTSNCTDFQARRLNIKFRQGEKIEFVHMLNGTAFAIGRTIIAILENYQQKDSSVIIPKALREYTNFDKILPKNS